MSIRPIHLRITEALNALVMHHAEAVCAMRAATALDRAIGAMDVQGAVNLRIAVLMDSLIMPRAVAALARFAVTAVSDAQAHLVRPP